MTTTPSGPSRIIKFPQISGASLDRNDYIWIADVVNDRDVVITFGDLADAINGTPAPGTGTNLSWDAATSTVGSSTGQNVKLTLFAPGVAGLVPAAPALGSHAAGLVEYLAEDGTWQTPALGHLVDVDATTSTAAAGKLLGTTAVGVWGPVDAAVPVATADVLGGIKVGPSFSVDTDGTLKNRDLGQLVLNVSTTGSATPAAPLPVAMKGAGDAFALVSQAAAWREVNFPTASLMIKVAAGTYVEPAAFRIKNCNIQGEDKTTTLIDLGAAQLDCDGQVIFVSIKVKCNNMFWTETSSGRFNKADVEGQVTCPPGNLRIIGTCRFAKMLVWGTLTLANGGKIELDRPAGVSVPVAVLGTIDPAMEIYQHGSIAYNWQAAAILVEVMNGPKEVVVKNPYGLTMPLTRWAGNPVFSYELPQPLRDVNLAAGGGLKLTPSGSGESRLITIGLDTGSAALELKVDPAGSATPASPLPVGHGGNADAFALPSQAMAFALTIGGIRTLTLQIAAGTYEEPTGLQLGGDVTMLVVRGAGAATTVITSTAAPTGNMGNFASVNGATRLFNLTLRGPLYQTALIVNEGSSLRLSNCSIESDPNKIAIQLNAAPLRLIGTSKMTGVVYLAGPVLFGQNSKVEINAGVGAGMALFHDDTAGFARNALAISGVETNKVCWDLTGPQKIVNVEGARGIISRPDFWAGNPVFVYRSSRAIAKDLVYINQADYTALATKDPAVQYVLVPT